MNDAPPTAQTQYHQMVRDLIAPALRDMGFKGTRGNYEKRYGDWRTWISFTKSRHSNRDTVACWVQVGVEHLPTVNAYGDANKEAGAAGRTIEVEPAGKLWTQLGTIAEDGTLTGSGPLNWEVGTSGSAEPIVADILRRIKTAIPAALDREMSRPLVPPSPVESRPFRAQPARRAGPT